MALRLTRTFHSIFIHVAIVLLPVASIADDVEFGFAYGTAGGFQIEGNAVAVDASGNAYTTGYFEGTVDFDPGAGVFDLVSTTRWDIFITKLDSNGDFVWAKSFGVSGGEQDIGWGIAVGPSGNVHVGGKFHNTIDFNPGAGTNNLTSAGSSDAFILKLDSNGNFLWAKSMGGTGWEECNDIDIDSSGYIYSIGRFRGTADFDPNGGISNLVSAGNEDIFVQKLDSSGNFVWAKRLGGTGIDYGHGIAVDSSGNVLTTGFFQDSADFNPGPGTATLNSVNGSFDIFVSKLNSTGNYVWAKAMGSSGTDEGNDVAVDVAGNVYTTGKFTGTADFNPGAGTNNLTSNGGDNTFIQKLDSSGNFTWAKSIGGNAGIWGDVGWDVIVDESGSVYTTGTYAGTVDFDPGAGTANLNGNTASIFVQKLSTTGNFVWAKSMGDDFFGGSIGYGITLDATRNVHTTGLFAGTAVDFDPGAGVVNLAYSVKGAFVSRLDVQKLSIVYANFDTGLSSAIGGETDPVDSVQAALNRAESGGLIKIAAGTTSETATISDNITLQRNGSTGTVIIGDTIPAADDHKTHPTSGYITNQRRD